MAKNISETAKVEFATSTEVKLLEPYIAQILDAIKLNGAWVSDSTCLSDFAPDFGSGNFTPKRLAWYKEIGNALGIEIDPGNTSIVELAKQLRHVQDGDHDEADQTHH